MNHRLDLKVGYRCNNHCWFCVQGDKRTRFKDKTREEVLSILKKRAAKNSEVVFTGGEATIRKEIFEWFSCARNLGYKLIQIQTNGRMFAYKDFCRKAIQSGANHFALALHGSKKEVHDTLTRAPGSFDQTVQGIKNLKEMGQSLALNSVVNKMNYKDLPDLARLLVSLGVEQFQFAFIHVSPVIMADQALIEKIVPRKSEAIEYIKQGLQIGIDNGRMVMAEAVPYCFMKGYENYVAEKYIPSTSIEDLFFVEDFEAVRKEEGKRKGPQCRECKYYNICEGPWREYPEIFGWDEFKPVKE